ncbi:ABC transporter permease subunit [bacterium]|nr:ABC transporter permease subunit [bacterium]
MYALWANIFDNPILVRELRRRMRGKALLYSIISYLFLMTLATIIVMLSYSPSSFERPSTETLQRMKHTGEVMFNAITAIQVLLVLIIAPTITAGLTTGEKERQTFDFLRVTTISRWMYIVGCFLSTCFYVALALLCALPLQAVTFLYGGVSLGDVMGTFIVLLCSSAVLSAFGLFISSVTEKTRTAQGMVIFLVFGILFGGLMLVQSYRSVFQGATSLLPAAAGGLFVAGLQIPAWAIVPATLAVFAFLFLLLAARKLFESDEARALNHWQYLAAFAAVMGISLGILGANQFTNEFVEWSVLSVGYVMLLAGVLIFSTGRMEVGDEVWHLKRLVPVLRPIDQTVPFLVLVGAIWWTLVGMIPQHTATPQLKADAVMAFRLCSTASFVFLVVLGRFLTATMRSSAKAFRVTLAVVCCLTFLIPLLSGAGRFALDLDPLWSTIECLSPLGMITSAVYGNTGGANYVGPATVASVALLVVGAVLGLIGEVRRYQRWKHFDYHYDMPAR